MNTAQQIGAALGLAVLITISTIAATARLPESAAALQRGLTDGDDDLVARAAHALSHGYTTTYLAAGLLFVAVETVVTVTVTTGRQPPTSS